MPTYVYIDRYIHTHMHTHTYIQRTSRVATSVLSGRLVLAKVQADQKKRIITGSEYSSPPPSQTRFCRKATPLACKRNTLDKKTSLNISFGTRGSIFFFPPAAGGSSSLLSAGAAVSFAQCSSFRNRTIVPHSWCGGGNGSTGSS